MRQATYVRIYNDDAGESHFEDMTVDMPSVEFAPPATPLDVARLFEAKSCSLVGAAADWDSVNFHPSPRRQLMVLLRGEIEVQASDGATRFQHPGDLYLMEDTQGKGHITRAIGTDDIFAVTVALD